MTPAGFHEQVAPFGHITLDGVLIRGLIGTGASVSCLAHATWWHNRATCWALHPHHQFICGANDKPLPIAGHMRYLWLKWGSATDRASFIVIMGLAGTLTLIGMDLMVSSLVRINAASCTAMPKLMHTLQAQEDTSSEAAPGCVSTETATQTATNPTTSFTSDIMALALAALLQGVQVPAESVRFVQVANPWLNCTVCFEPSLELPLCVFSASIVVSGPTVWVALHNLWMEPVLLKAAEVMEPPGDAVGGRHSSLGELVPGHLSLIQQRQLMQLLEAFRDVHSRDEDDRPDPCARTH